MKKFTRIASLLLALVMVLGLAATAFAEEDQQFTITIDTQKDNLRYNVYQIFTGYVTEKENGTRPISDLGWGESITEEGRTALLSFDKAEGEEPFADVEALARYLSDMKDIDETIGERFAAAATNYLIDSPYKVISKGANGDYSTTVPGGYYVIKSVDALEGTGDETAWMLKVAGNISVTPKIPGPKLVKRAYNNNDSTNPDIVSVKANGVDVGISTWDIGDSVPFMLIGTVPSDINAHSKYIYTYHDYMDDGFEFTEADLANIVVQVMSYSDYETVDPADYTAAMATKDGKNGFTVEMDVKAILAKYQSEVEGSIKNICVRYNAVLGEKAQMGAHYNKNEAWIEYENDGGIDKTPDDEVWTGTLQFTVHKVEIAGEDEEGNPTYIPLKGAEFKLQKFMQKDDGAETVTFTYNDEIKSYTGEWVDFQNQFVVAENGTDFSVKGLDEGIYKLIETKAPRGYAKADDLIFRVVTAENYQYGALTKMAVCTQDGTEDIFSKFGNRIDTPDGPIMDATRFETTVVNTPDEIILPETGGMGTTLFYVLGAILVLGAAVLLITKRRMNTEN